MLGSTHTPKKRIFRNSLKDETFQVGTSAIVSAKKFALRRGIWYRALSRVERGVLDLTARYVECIRSAKLAKVVTAILQKLKQASESMIDRLVRTVGLPLAQKISAIALQLGNTSAAQWATDTTFARYLSVMDKNR